jgi:hypothetical protein
VRRQQQTPSSTLRAVAINVARQTLRTGCTNALAEQQQHPDKITAFLLAAAQMLTESQHPCESTFTTPHQLSSVTS